MKQKEVINKETGEITVEQLNVVKKIITRRPNGTLRIQNDFSNCPTMAEQHTAHLTDINYLIEKYKPDELQAYLDAKNQYRQEIIGHDFSQEPSFQEAHNILYRTKKEFSELPQDIQNQFKSPLEFLKFIDNPANAEKMIKLGILTPRQVENIQTEPTNTTQSTPTPTKEKEKDNK